jgi:hypothetical protein
LLFGAIKIPAARRDVTMRPWFHAGQMAVIAEDYHPVAMLGSLLPPTKSAMRCCASSVRVL